MKTCKSPEPGKWLALILKVEPSEMQLRSVIGDDGREDIGGWNDHVGVLLEVLEVE